MSLASRLGSRFKSALAAEIVKVVAGAILVTLLARLLGPNAYGVLFLAISLFSVAKLFSAFGIGKSASRYIAEYKETDPGQIPHVLRVSFIFNLTTVCIVLFFVVTGREYITHLLDEPELSQLLLIGGAFILFDTLWSYTRRCLQGFEFIKASSALTAGQKVSRMVFALGLVLLGYGAVGALTGYILSSFFVAIVGLAYLYWRGIYQIQSSPIEPGLKRRIVEYSLPIAVTQSAHTIGHHFDKVLVGFFIGPLAVAYYTVGKQVVSFIETPMSALGFTLSPTYGSQKSQGNTETAARIYETALSQGLLFYVPAATGIVLVAEPGVTLVFGQEYRSAVPVLQILALYAIFQSIAKLTSSGLDFLGRARHRAIIKGVTATMNVGLNIALIPILGAAGAAVATVITFGIYTMTNFYIMNIELDLNLNLIAKNMGYAVGVSIIMAAVVAPLTGFVTGFITLFAVVALGIAVWVMLVLGFGLINVDLMKSTLD